MTIVDLEVVSEAELPRNDFPNVPLGILLEKVFQKNYALYGDAKWMTDVSTGQSMNYSEMMKSVRSVASGLRKRGFKTGDSLVTIAPNRIELPLMAFGVQRAGGFQTNLDPGYLLSGIVEAMMREIKPKFILTDTNNSSSVAEFSKKFDFISEMFVIGDAAVSGFTPFNQLLQDPGNECPENLDEIDLDSICLVPFSSGTTDVSKPIIRSHKSIISAFLRVTNMVNTRGFKYLFSYPMIHMTGITMSTAFSLAHAEIYFLSDFSEIKLLSAIDSVKPTELGLQPYLISWICRFPHLDQYDLSSVMKITLIGSVVNPIHEREIFDKFPNLLFLSNAYGSTEFGILSDHPIPRTDEWGKLEKSATMAKRVFGSAGKVIAGCKLKVVDVNSGEKLGPNQIGEICAYPPTTFKGYFNNPQETANIYRNGWIHTGDQGYYDENENVFICGRYKEIIKYRILQVQPSNIERHMMTHPAIANVAVVGVPDEVDGQHPLAFVVLKSDSQGVTADELINYTNERLANAEKLRGGIRFIDEIPRNNSGKIVRRELLKLLRV